MLCDFGSYFLNVLGDFSLKFHVSKFQGGVESMCCVEIAFVVF